MKQTRDISNANFGFLDSQLAKEAYIYDILGEIQQKQVAYLHSSQGFLMTLTELQQSRTIRIPYTNTRNNNIQYLTDTLCKKHPDYVRAIPSFSFTADKDTKKLSLHETIEFTVNMDDATFNSIRNLRNTQSKNNILELFAMFRLTNLTKLLMNSSNKAYLMDLLKEDEDKNIFMFRQYGFDKNMNEIAEIYCFNKKNFEHVKNGLNLDDLRSIIATNSAAIVRKMKTFGILNISFTDYTDSKLDYLISATLDELSPNFNKKDIILVKNIASLRTCLLSVNKYIDPLIASAAEISAYIKKNGVCKDNELAAVFANVTTALLASWPIDHLEKRKIVTVRDEEGTLYFIDAASLTSRVEELHKRIILKPEAFSMLSDDERRKTLNMMTLLCDAGSYILSQDEKTIPLLGNETLAQKLVHLINDYEKYKSSNKESSMKHRKNDEYVDRNSLISKIISFFSSIFGGSKTAQPAPQAKSEVRISKVPFSPMTQDLFTQIKNRTSPLIPLSDYIELTQENRKDIDTIINELRANFLKIVVPIYNARTVLYPTRSQGYIISDMEYLMMPIDIITSADTIRDFTDSLVGIKLKDEVIPSRAIMAIENYLLTLYRQQKANARRNKLKERLNN